MSASNPNPWRYIIVIALSLIMLGQVCMMDFDDLAEGERRYCEMVKGGNWPEYNGNINCN